MRPRGQAHSPGKAAAGARGRAAAGARGSRAERAAGSASGASARARGSPTGAAHAGAGDAAAVTVAHNASDAAQAHLQVGQQGLPEQTGTKGFVIAQKR